MKVAPTLQFHRRPSNLFETQQVPIGAVYAVSQPPVEDARLFSGKRVAILVAHGVEESGISFPDDYLTQRGAQVDLLIPASAWTGARPGVAAVQYLEPTFLGHGDQHFPRAQGTHYDPLVLTCGAWNAQVVRSDADALKLILDDRAVLKVLGRPGQFLASVAESSLF